MKMEGHSNLNDTRILEIIIALLINLIIFSTNNKLMMYTKYLSLFIIVLCFGLFVSKKDYTVKMNKFIGLYGTLKKIYVEFGYDSIITGRNNDCRVYNA